ncbi:transposase [Streptomyces sp. NPDC088183]|uniref:transposase n=1 Tax=unclassified Streptomyces TaxID=2593676 RepID=UPI003419EDB5
MARRRSACRGGISLVPSGTKRRRANGGTRTIARSGGDGLSKVPAGRYALGGHGAVARRGGTGQADRRGLQPVDVPVVVLDPDKAPATELAALYAQRWEFESTLDEIKTHLGGPHLVLRSQHPDGAEQELYGFLLVHHAIRHLMHQAAQQADQDPDRVSFTRSLRVARRQVTDQAAFSPRQTRSRGQSHPR